MSELPFHSELEAEYERFKQELHVPDLVMKAYVSGTLPQKACKKIVAHLANCASCRETEADMRVFLGLESVGSEEIERELTERATAVTNKTLGIIASNQQFEPMAPQGNRPSPNVEERCIEGAPEHSDGSENQPTEPSQSAKRSATKSDDFASVALQAFLDRLTRELKRLPKHKPQNSATAILAIIGSMHSDRARVVMEAIREIGYEVFVADTGATGLSLFQELHESIPIVILDYHLHDMNALKAEMEIKKIRGDVRIVKSSFVDIKVSISVFSSLVRKELKEAHKASDLS